MAKRPFFYVLNGKVKSMNVEFEWAGGFARSQKQKCIKSMHDSIKNPMKPLEVSTYSESELGQKLSAFSLKLDGIHLENIYQSSKIYEKGGPFLDLLEVEQAESKRDSRHHMSGKMIGFEYKNERFSLEPQTCFYNYIYYLAVKNCLSEDELEELSQYNAFTDIWFNPAKGIATQAEGVAIVVDVYRKNGCLPDLKFEDIKKYY